MGKNQALFGSLVVIAILLIGAWYFTWGGAPASLQNVPAAGEVTLQGTMVCLPHRDTSGPQTLECAFGLQGDDGNYYGLSDADPSYANISSAQTGARVEVHGIFAQGEDQTYATVGTITIDRVTPLTASGATTTPTETTSDGTIRFTTPESFGLAVTAEQILVNAYIPPCDQGFDYCLYYNDTAYEGTNFESAGLAIEKRDDLTSQETCLTTQPSGYSNLHATTTEESGYGMSVLGPLGDAGVGHYASGEEYRLFARGTCYQFDTRVGETQFANFPEGSITKFSDAERTSMFNTLRGIIRQTLSLSDIPLSLPR